MKRTARSNVATLTACSFLTLVLGAAGMLGCADIDDDAMWVDDEMTEQASQLDSDSVLSSAVIRLASVENGSLSEFDQTNGNVEVVADHAYDGVRGVHAWTPANALNQTKYARGLFAPNWGAGTDVWYGVAVYLPNGFYAAQQGQVDLMRWDNWTVDPTNTDRGGIVVYGSDKKARFVRQRLGVEQVALVGPFTISEGVWHWIEVHQRFSADNASDLSEVYMDGQLVGSSTAKNWYGRPITRIRYGLVAVNDTAQANRLDLWFDRAAIASEVMGL